jgi:hypothetical protein
MFIGQPNFPMLTADQANPAISGLARMIQMHLQRQQAQLNDATMPFAGPQAQANLQRTQLGNQGAEAQLPYIGPQAAADLQKAQLGNQFYAPEAQAQIGLQNAQAGNLSADTRRTNYMLNNPGFLAGGSAAEVQALQNMGVIPAGGMGPQSNVGGSPSATKPGGMSQGIMNALQPQQQQGQQQGNPSQPFQTGNPMVDAILNKGFAKPAYDAQMTQAFTWTHAPVDAKRYMIAEAAGMGIDPNDAVAAFSQGKTVNQLAQENGFDPNNKPSPDFLPTSSNITTLKQRQAALKEVDSLGQFINQGLGPYSQTYRGMSPLQVKDAISGQNPDQQANFLAARMLAPELANIRLKLAQGQAGVTAADEIMNKSLMNVNAYQSLVTPDVFTSAQNKADDALKQAFGKAEEAYTVGGKKGTQASDAGNSANETHWTVGPDGKLQKVS